MVKFNSFILLLVVLSISLFLSLVFLPGMLFAAEGDLIWAQISNPSSFDDRAKDAATDSTGIYAVGYDREVGVSSPRWRIEKRTLTDGSSIWTKTNSPSGGLDSANSVAVDSTGIYVVGTENAALLDLRWRIEKRSLVDGSLIWIRTVNPSIFSDMAYDVTVDSTGVYIAGYMDSFKKWRIEKRSLIDGSLIWSRINDPTPNADKAYGVAVDGTGLYIVGYDYPNGVVRARWRIEKRSLIDGSLIWERINNPTPENDVAYGVAVDSTGIYVVGYDSSDLRWRIEKRSLINGNLIWGRINNHSVNVDIPYRVTVDSTGLYVVGYDSFPGVNDPQWRIEKHSLTDGGLIWERTNNPGTPDIADFAEGISIGSSGIYIGGSGNGGWRIEKRCLISCPPTASFTVTPPSGTTSTTFNVDASGSSDPETPLADLQVRWDWENDGIWDTGWSTTKTNSHTYSTAGVKTIKMEVKDTGGLTDDMIRRVSVVSVSPPTADDQNVTTDQNMAKAVALSGVKGGDGVVNINGSMTSQPAALGTHSLSSKLGGSAWTWGLNIEGQIGDETYTDALFPVQVKGEGGVGNLTDTVAVSGGGFHSLALKSDGTVWTWGYNTDGQLGDGTKTGRSTPVQVKGEGGVGNLTDIVAVSGGSLHSLALKSDGTVWAWGNGEYGRLGNGSSDDRSTPVQVKGEGGVGNLTDIVAVSGGVSHSLALKSDGTVWAWGMGNDGRLGNGSHSDRSTPVQVKGEGGVGNLTDIVAVSGSGDHSLALKSDGTVWTWGWNSDGQLGDGTTGMKSTPVQVKGEGGVGNLTDIVAVSRGKARSLALKSDGTVWTWGWNNLGQLGDGTTDDRSTPVQVKGEGGVGNLTDIVAVSGGRSHSLVLKSDSTVWAWGSGSHGQRGDGTISNSMFPIRSQFPLTYIISSLPANGSLKDAANNPIATVPYSLGTNPNVTYTPNLNFVSPPNDSFQFKVNDGIQDSAAATVSITVNPTTDFSISSSRLSLKAPQTGASDSPNPTILVSPVIGFNSNVAVSMQACVSSLASSCNDTNSFPLGASVTFLPDGTITLAEYNNLTSFRFDTSATAPGTYYFRIKGVGGSPSVTRYSSIISLAVVDLTISSFTADPSSGAAPLNDVDLTAGVGGSAIGTVNFKFHCDAPASPGVWEHSFDGVDITVVDAIPVNRIDMEGHTHSTQRLSGGQFKVFDLCDYGTAGTYTPRVKVERDVANPAEQTVSVQVDSVLTLTVQVNGLGKIEGNGINWDPDGVDGTVNNTPADQTETYADNTPVSLTATAGTGSVFDHWQSDVALPCTGGPFNPVCDFNITEDINPLIAVFDTPLLRVTPNETIIRVNQSFQFEAWYDPDGDDVGEYKVTRCAGAGANPDYPGDAAKNCVGSITWNTSDSAVASINLEGSILAVSRGTTAISATYNAIDSNSNAMVRVIRYKWEER